MLIKKIISVTLSLALLSAAIPVNAQPKPKNTNKDNGLGSTPQQFGNYGDFSFDNPNFGLSPQEKLSQEEMQKKYKERIKKLNDRVAMAYIMSSNPYEGLGYLDAYYVWQKLPPHKKTKNFSYDYYIAPAWQGYNNAIKDYTLSSYNRKTPYQMMQAIDKETKAIAEALKKNPRYIKEVKKAKAKEIGGAVLDGIIAGLTLVAAYYTCGLAGCTIGTSWFGGTAAAGTMLSAASTMSLTKAGITIVLLEVASVLGMDITSNLYADLTDRLVKYNYIDNGTHAKELIDVAAAGCIANAQTVDTTTCKQGLTMVAEEIQKSPKPIEVNANTRWLDNIAKEEAIIRLHALQVIKAELLYSLESYKYDLALLDIINLLSLRQEVIFDENIFTRTVIAGGEKHYEHNTNIVDVGTGRLIQRTPELIKALKAIQTMESASAKNGSRNLSRHPREVNGHIWPSK